MHKTILLAIDLILIFMNVFPVLTNYDYPLEINYIQELDKQIIETYFSNITINTIYGSIIESYSSKDYYVTSQRMLGLGLVRNTIYYELIPPPEASYYTIDWLPGVVFTTPTRLSIVENTPYRLVARATINTSTLFNVVLIKEYVFYYDKPYFDVKYVFINNDNKTVEFNLSNEYNRPVSFFIEISTCFGNDYTDDLQIINTIRETYIYRNFTSTAPIIAPGLINFIGLASYFDDYNYSQAVIVLPINKTREYTYAAQVYTSQVFDTGTSIVRLEIKSFKIEPGNRVDFNFRVFMGILSDVFLNELGIIGLKESLRRTVPYYIPYYPPDYSAPPYKVDLRILLPKPDLYLNATLYMYRLLDNGDTELIKEIDLSKATRSVFLELDKPGLYVFRIDPSYGFTSDYMYIYEETYINNIIISKAVIPILNNIVVNISFRITPINWVTILVIDENYYLAEFVRNNPIVVELRDRAGNTRRIIIREPVTDLYVPPGLYEIVVKPIETVNNKLTDIFFNNYYVLHSMSTNETRFSILLKGVSRDMVVLRYVSLRTMGINPVVLLIAIASLVAVACMLTYILFRLIRGRRL